MGCFLGCFGSPKDRSRRKTIKKIPPGDHRFPEHYKLLQQNSLPRPPPPPQPSSPLRLQLLSGEEERPGSHLEPRDRSEKQNPSSPRKKVTFDLNVKTYEREPEDDDVSGDDEEDRDQQYSDEGKTQRLGISTPASSEAFPSNHRYQNCTIGDGEEDSEEEEEEEDGDDEYSDDYDEEDVSEREDCGLDDDGDDDGVDAVVRGINQGDESFESYFSPTMGKNNHGCKDPSNERATEVSGHGARGRSRYVDSVLNPVENLSQWKEAKAKRRPLDSRDSKKENICLGTKNEVLVEASLSNWLPSPPSEVSTVKKGLGGNNSCRAESKVVLHGRTMLDGFSI